MLTRKLIFDGLEISPWLFVFATAVLAAAVLIVMLLRYERRLVPRKVGFSLLVLRLGVLAVLLFTLAEPVLRRTLDTSEAGRVVVALDLSESMTTTDAHAGGAEKLRWARALGMIGNEQTNARIDRWIEAYESRREPEWVDPGEAGDAERRAALERSRRETVEGVFAELDKLSRKEIALRLLTAGREPLLAKLKETGNVELRLFAGKTAAADETTLARLVADPPKSVRPQVSDLSQALSAGTETGETAPLAGVVVFTDGRDNAGQDTLGAARRLGQIDAPVFPVLLGTVRRPTDIAIADLDYPETAFKDDKPVLRAKLHTSGFEEKEIQLVLERRGKEPVTKTVTPDGPEAAVEFELTAEEIGRHEYTLRTDVQQGETRDDNNARTFAMNVVDDVVRVLLVEGEARWEFRFLDNALTRDERAEVKRVVYRQPYMGVLGETFFPRSLQVPDDPEDLENSPFAEPDLVILGDVAPEDLPERGWQLLEKFVGEAGGTLVIIAGKNHMPTGYNSPVVDALLPVMSLRPLHVAGPLAEGAPSERGFNLQLTPEGERESMFRFDTDPSKNRAIWAKLPGHMWGLLGEAKPGAVVFAHAFQKGEQQTLDDQRQNAVIVQQHYGFGQVLWVGIDSTWRWRHRVGDRYHHRFWGQIGRWAAANKAIAGNENVRFGPERSELQLGEDAVIRARWSRGFLKRFPDLAARVKIYKAGDRRQRSGVRGQGSEVRGQKSDDVDDDGRRTTDSGQRTTHHSPLTNPTFDPRPFTTLELGPLPYRPLVYEARAVSLPVGQYRCVLEVEGAHLGEEISTPLYVRDVVSQELQELSANRPLLEQIANVSKGRVLLPDELDDLPDRFRDPAIHTLIGEEILLWDHWLIMAAFFALLMVEWVTRKLNGLP